ncbi:MAG TPA: PEP-CTERM sorting domain-containing protein [Burkholderiales bacterium]|nr:PEP-CTERM sorting domain-containing protein [Burkholderiales bacterium]
MTKGSIAEKPHLWRGFCIAANQERLQEENSMKQVIRATIILVFSLVSFATAAAPSLLGQTIGVAITATGSDDFGPYTINVFNSAVVAASGTEVSQPFSKQLTNMGFSTPSNLLTGTASVNITDSGIAVGFAGQAQPFMLDFDFTGIAGDIDGLSLSTSGILAGVNMELSPSFTDTSISDMGFFFFGYQPGTNTVQTAGVAFAPSVPEPSSLVLAALAVVILACGVLRARRFNPEEWPRV